MKEPLKAVVDTNIFVSALIGSPTCKEIKDHLLKGRFILLVSGAMLGELLETVAESKFEKLMKAEDVKELTAFIESRTMSVASAQAVTACRDPKDNFILECAVAGNADVIVTGDKDLLSMKIFEGIEIIPPREFVNRFSKETEAGNNV